MREEEKKEDQGDCKEASWKGYPDEPPYSTWKEFDRDLANDFSKFITGNLYSRTVLTLPERQLLSGVG